MQTTNLSEILRKFLTEIRTLLDPLTLLLLLGIFGFYQFYGGRFLIFVVIVLALIGLWGVWKQRTPVAVPIAVFLTGTWAYNFFEGRNYALVGVMAIFFLLIMYAFWRLLDRPSFKHLTILHSLYFTLATLIVWELAVLIKIFWPVEPWSRTFLVVAAMVFLEFAIRARLAGTTTLRPLAVPFIIVVTLIIIVISSTPISII